MALELSERIARSTWLVPSGEALAALARPGRSLAAHSRLDPAGQLLLRQASAEGEADARSRCLERCLTALAEAGDEPIDLELMAEIGLRADQLRALVAGLHLVRSSSHADALADAASMLLVGIQAIAQADPAALAEGVPTSELGKVHRHLARRWAIPPETRTAWDWLQANAGQQLAPENPIWYLIAAVGLLQSRGALPWLPSVPEAVWADHVSAEVADGLLEELFADLSEAQPWTDPRYAPYLRDVLELALERERDSQRNLVLELEREIDLLHERLEGSRHDRDAELEERKLVAVAELAAGAGHEINNPLAVISGQAQLLLLQEDEPIRQKALQTIVQQTKRIHRILLDLMQFARPGKPNKQLVDLPQLLRDAVATFTRAHPGDEVDLQIAVPEAPVLAYCDPKQTATVVQNLLLNGKEAIGEHGWLRVSLVTGQTGQVEIRVEDSGGGPAKAAVEHLFDPFYSGRSAGRGRGLGLSAAWQLSRQQGGTLRYAPEPHTPARFVLQLPAAPRGSNDAADRRSA